jgi:outer membrane protein assembly factor BamB
MHMSVTCPRCESKYQLDAAMRGKKMRCPNTICRAVFEVRGDGDAPVAEAPPPAKPAEPKPEPEPVKPRPVPKPVAPPPVDDFPGDDEPAPAQVEAKKPEPVEPRPIPKPIALPPRVEAKKPEPVKPKPIPKPIEVPPVRELAPAPVEAKKPEPVAPKPIPKPIEAPPVRETVPATPMQIEAAPAADFPDDFPGDGDAAPATTSTAIATEAWQPEPEWDAPPVREEPEPVRELLTTPTPAPVKRRRALWVIGGMLLVLGIVIGAGFWRFHGGAASNEAERYQKAETLYTEHQFADASVALQKLQRDFADSPHNKKYRFLAELSDVRFAAYMRESPEETVNALKRVLQLITVYKGEELLKEREADLFETLEFLAKELTELAEREKTLGFLTSARLAWGEAKKYPASNKSERERKLEEDWSRIEQAIALHLERQHVVAALKNHLKQANAAAVQEAFALVEKTKRQGDGEIRGLLDDLIKAHREQVKFVPPDAATTPQLAPDDDLPSLSVTPIVQAASRERERSEPTKENVLALARGVLYVLEPTRGELRWVRRLGIDTHVLPLRVPADAITPELLLALSTDQRSLSALIAKTGETLWQTPLSDACPGQPVLVDRQILAPTLAGRIDVIEIAEGRLLGSYHVGQALTIGGVREPGTNLVHFPGDEFCLYTIDVTKPTCANILYTRHPAGSLPGLPTIVSSTKGSYLLWSQAKGPGNAEIKPYELPIAQPDQKPVEPMVTVPGLSAPPWCDGDRLAAATQAGFLSLWGIRQKGTRDPLLFPLLKQDFAIDASKAGGRCQVVHADAENYWTLTRGRLQRVQATFDPKEGPGLLTRWTQPIVLGSLLHAARVSREPDGRTILYLTTQADDHPTCLCSAIDADDGKVLWQRQLGVLPVQAPRTLAGQIVLRGANGLLRFDPAKHGDKPEPWQPAGAWLEHLPLNPGSQFLLTRESSYVLLSATQGKKLQARIGAIDGDAKARTVEIPLADPLQGTPALGDGFLLLPLASGIIVRVNLDDGTVLKGPDWRAVGAEDQARGHLVMLGATEFIRTDGSRGLARIASTDGKTWDQRAERKLEYRIVKTPILLPGADGAKARLCVADASDTVTLLDADRLSVLRNWTMPGKITIGPFVRAGKIACVVGRSRLVWLDPEREKFAWEYTFADIVGAPQIIDDVIVVADVAGRFVALDPANGGPRGPVLTLKANVAATAAPLPFGPGRAFVPLTDGTIAVLPLDRLRRAK